MWLAGAVGVATALGFYVIAGAVALFAILVLAVLRAFSHRVLRSTHAEATAAEGRGEKP